MLIRSKSYLIICSLQVVYPKENDYKNIRLEADLALNTIPANKKSALNSSKIPSNDPDFA